MSYKISLMLSMIFVALFFAFGIDLIMIQFTYSDLDAKSTAISYQIAQYGTIDDSLVSLIENKYNVAFNCTGNCNPMFGDVVDYTLSKNITTLVVSQGSMKISISRSAVIGFYN